jgi:hypothetical protein
VLLGGILRFWGLRFGLPHLHARPDEQIITDIGHRILGGDPNPHFFDYPSLFMYLLAAGDYLYYLYGRAAGWFASLAQFVSLWPTEWTPFFLVARVLSASAGTATVAVVYQIGKRLFDPMVGLVAAFFLSVAFLHVRDSHFGVTDVTMTFLLMTSMLFIVRAWVDGKRSSFELAGYAGGLAASTKYNGALLVVPLVVCVLLRAFEASSSPQDLEAGKAVRQAIVRIGTFAACFAVAFVAASPFVIISADQFLHDLRGVARHMATPHSIDLGRGGIYHITFSLRYGVGVPLLGASLAGLAWLAARDWRKLALLGSLPLAYYAAVFSQRTVFVRYVTPLVPFVSVAAAVLVVDAARLLGRRRSFLVAPAVALLSLAVAAPSIHSTLRIDRLFAATDTRLLAADWIRENVPAGSSLYMSGSVAARPIVEWGPVQVYRYWDHREGWVFAEKNLLVKGWPDWLVLTESGVPQYSYCPTAVKQLAEQEYHLVRAFKAMDLEGNLFDRQDAFFYPYAGFRSATRGGPNYSIYVRTERH